jgi:hypothetical protein
MKEYTFDTEMAIANLRNIKKVLGLINDRRASVSSAEDFLHSPDGMAPRCNQYEPYRNRRGH